MITGTSTDEHQFKAQSDAELMRQRNRFVSGRNFSDIRLRWADEELKRRGITKWAQVKK